MAALGPCGRTPHHIGSPQLRRGPMAARRRPPTEKNGSVVRQPEIGGDLAAAGLVGRWPGGPLLAPNGPKKRWRPLPVFHPHRAAAAQRSAPEPRAAAPSAPPRLLPPGLHDSTARRSRGRAPGPRPPPPGRGDLPAAGAAVQGSRARPRPPPVLPSAPPRLAGSPQTPSTAGRSRPRAPAAAPGRPPPRGSACRGAGQQGQGSSPPPAGLSRFPLPPARAAPAGRRRGRGTPAGLLAPEGRGPDPAIPVLRQSRGVPVLTAQRTAQICSFHLD